MSALDIVILGLSITSSWGNGHAITYRGLTHQLAARGHKISFLERDLPWYAENRDLPKPSYAQALIYKNLSELKRRFTRAVRRADLVIVGSYVPYGVEVGKWVVDTASGITAFYDIDTPVTLSLLEQNNNPYLSLELIRRYRLYLSFTGGPVLKRLEREYGSPMARALYCAVNPEEYFPQPRRQKWQVGYMGTYSKDRQEMLEQLMIEPARRWPAARMVVAGPQYPAAIRWPKNVQRIEHLPPSRHRAFYNGQRFTLNLTRADMVQAGYSPSIRLFETAACARPIISDYWRGLEQFFKPGEEILLAHSPEQVLEYLVEIPERDLERIGRRARARVLAKHTAAQRALELETYIAKLS